MTASSPSEIAVIVVNYGTADLAIEAVGSVRARNHGGRRVDLHLVDNASPGGKDAAAFQRAARDLGWGADVTLHLESENHGFGRGNNLVLQDLAARPAPPTYVFLLNPDARLENEALDILAAHLDAHPKAAFAGAGIDKPGTGAVTAAFRFPRPVGEFTRALAFGPVTRLAPNLVVPLPPDHPQGPVGWVAGAAVLIRFEALKALEFFDPEYFLYYEEVDLMHRAARAGWETWFVPQARVIHAEGAATNVRSGVRNRPRKPAYWYRSWRKYFTDTYGPVGVRIAALCWVMGAVGNLLLSLIPGRGASVPNRFFGDFWAVVLRPLLGLREGSYG
ncbi:glycosyltransferase [Tropicimonas sp. S265A]|uniref:glycosyltransferase n=1 Tax=Tropicimonas sp. S265A TaxID=3415134 RepID=UPI003C79AB37